MRQLGVGGPKKPKDVSNLKKLETVDLKGIAKHLKTCKNIIFMSGAGISTCKPIKIISFDFKYVSKKFFFQF